MVAIQIIFAALIQAHHVAAHLVAILAHALGRKLGGFRVLRLGKGFAFQTRRRVMHRLADVTDLFQAIDFHRRAALLFGSALRQETRLHVIGFVVRNLFDAMRRTMMV